MTTTAETQRVRARFHALAGEFFPRWRGARAWRIRIGHPPAACGDGYCDPVRRTVWVSPETARGEALDVVIVHELCHAVVGPYHGRRFVDRLRQAAAIAPPELSSAIRHEADLYEDLRREQPLAAVHAELRDAAVETADFAAAVRVVAAELGRSPRWVRERPRARAVFDEARSLYAGRGGVRG